MKALTIVFNSALAVIALALVMTIVTAVKQHRAVESTPRTIPMPAMGK
jgi:hypothetical protein